MENFDVKSELMRMAEEKYRTFAIKLLPVNVRDGVLGVRLPKLRDMAKQIVKSGRGESFLEQDVGALFEEKMLYGMVLGYIPLSDAQKLCFLPKFVACLDNWSVCDSCCASLNFNDKAKFWNWMMKNYAHSSLPYDLRFVLVMMLNHYCQKDYLPDILAFVGKIKSQDYYVETAQAWLLSMLYIRFPCEIEEFLLNKALRNSTCLKTIQKIIESRQINDVVRQKMRDLRHQISAKS